VCFYFCVIVFQNFSNSMENSDRFYDVYSTVKYSTVQYIIQYSTLYSTAQYSTVQYTVQYSTVQ